MHVTISLEGGKLQCHFHLSIYSQNVNGGVDNSIADEIQTEWTEIYDNFDDMNLKENLLRGIFAYGFEKPSAIQQRAIMPVIKGIHTSSCNFFLKIEILFHQLLFQ